VVIPIDGFLEGSSLLAFSLDLLIAVPSNLIDLTQESLSFLSRLEFVIIFLLPWESLLGLKVHSWVVEIETFDFVKTCVLATLV